MTAEPAGWISDICLYGDCQCEMPGCGCGCHTEFGCDHDHGGRAEECRLAGIHPDPLGWHVPVAIGATMSGNAYAILWYRERREREGRLL